MDVIVLFPSAVVSTIPGSLVLALPKNFVASEVPDIKSLGALESTYCFAKAGASWGLLFPFSSVKSCKGAVGNSES